MQPWNQSFERECRAQVEALCAPAAPAAPDGRERAWKLLLVRVAPQIEAWVSQSPLLRRCGLATPDDARAVLIDVIGRLRQHDFGNLHRFRAAQATSTPDDDAELEVVERLSRLASAEGAAGADADAPDEAREGTPLRGWLLGLTRFVIKDHVKQRMGWSRPPASPEDRERSRRDLTSNAERFDDLPEQGERPPITDLLTLRRRLEEMRAYADTFPPEMRQALELWMNDADFEEIARGVGVPSAERARALVRAAQARLRERFRGAATS